METALLCRKADRKIAFAAGMTVEEVHCLYSVAMNSPSCVKVLSDDLGLNAPRTSKVLRSLEQRGYVVRVLHAEDRRMEQVLLTPAGTAAAKTIVRLSREIGEKILRKETVEASDSIPDQDGFRFSD